LKQARAAHESNRMRDPGLNRHEWESELEALEEQLSESPAATLPELDRLIGRMLEETGYDVDDPVLRDGEEREVTAEFLAAREITAAAEDGSEEISPGDVAAAIHGYRAVFDHLVSTRASSELEPDLDEEDEA
jgi:hypothetical protein